MKNLTSVDKGDASEATVIAKLKQKGHTVLKPFGDNQRYDIVIDTEDGFEKVQVKTARPHHEKDGAVVFKTEGTHSNTNKNEKKPYDKSEIDSFIAYYHKENDLIYVPVEEAPKSSMILRYSAKTDQPQINWIEENKFEKRFD